MSAHSAIIIATYESESSGENEVLQHLCNHLVKLNINIKDTCKIINDDNCLGEYIRRWEDNCDFKFFTGNRQFICNTLSKIYKETLAVSEHLALLYNIDTENSADCQHIMLPNSSEIYQVHNHGNGINSIFVKYKNNFILPDDLTSIRVIIRYLIRPLLSNNNTNERYAKHFILNCNQNIINCDLNQYVNNSVHIKRFCVVQNGKCEQNIVLYSSNFNDLINSEKKINEIVPNNVMDKQFIEDIFWNDLKLIKKEDFVQQAMHVIEDCYSRYDPNDVFLSFNGGKDCTALLYLTLHMVKTLHPGHEEPLLCLYIQSPNPFNEVEDFIEQCRQFYNLKVITINSIVKTGLDKLLKEHPNLKACLMGTRRTDPYSHHLKYFQMTDSGWPQIMRVNPILDWVYSNIWHFLLTCNIPYCKLYDLGYTSLGSRTNTGPNPSLRYIDEETKGEKYLPAYNLQNGSEERSGRLQK